MAIILRELISSPLVPMSRLLDQLWGQDEDGGPISADNNIRHYVSRLRRILRPSYQIVRACKGYRLVQS